MRILLIDPPGKNKGLNTGLGYLYSSLKGTHSVRVLDLNNIIIGRCGDPNPQISPEQQDRMIARYLNDLRPELAGISVKTYTAEFSRRLIALLKEKQPGVICVVGGPHISLDGEQFLTQSGADFGLRGEGEYSLPALCDALAGKTGFDEVPGLIYRQDGEVRSNERSKDLIQLNALPFPNYENFSSVIENGGKIPEYPLLSSRGCPHKCSYCSMPEIMNRKWRSRDAKNVMDELRLSKEKYGSTSFTVVDDNLTLDVGRAEKICDLLIQERLNLPWNSQNGIRADRVSDRLARKMKASGCTYVWVGIESADDEVFNAIDKGETLSQISRGIRNLRTAGIGVGGFFILGLPGSTKERDLKIVKFVKSHDIDAFVFNFVPYPKTRASDWVIQNARLLRASEGALQFGNGLEPVFETQDYSREERIEAFNEINIRLRHFDRLVDSSLPQIKRWRKALQIVRPYGGRAVMALWRFIARYNAGLAINHLMN